MTSIARTAAVLAAAALLAAPTGRANVPQVFDFYVHGLSLDGRVSVNGTTVERYASELPGSVAVADENALVVAPEGEFVDPWLDVIIERPEDLWSALVVDVLDAADIAPGADRYALRRDGRVKRNDEDLHDLPGAMSPWLDMIAEYGRTYAVRADGALAVDGAVIAVHAPGSFHFRRVVRVARDVRFLRGDFDLLCLRSDGSVFRNDEFPMRLAFRAGSDGVLPTTTWTAAAVDPDLEFLYALRADGVVKRGAPLDGGVFGEKVATLPFDAAAEPLFGQLYVDLVFTANGTWYALTGDGRIYSDRSATEPFAELPWNSDTAGTIYTDLDVLGDSLYALRSDGRVYEAGTRRPLCHLPRAKHGSLALSLRAPVLTKRNTKRPRVTRVKTRIVAGTPLTLPVVAADLDTDAFAVVATPLELPPGAIWEPVLGTLVWAAPGPPGRHVFRFRVSDGANTKRFKYRIDVREPDLDPDTNARPLAPSFGRALAVAGEELVLPIIVDDPDGDPVTVAVDPRRYPFTAGATFDETTKVFRWTPTADDCGQVTLKFRVSDGGRPRIVRVNVRVKIGLFY